MIFFKLSSFLFYSFSDLAVSSLSAAYSTAYQTPDSIEGLPSLEDSMTRYVALLAQNNVPPKFSDFEHFISKIFSQLSVPQQLGLLRNEILGRDIVTRADRDEPKFGDRLTLYADYTASGRSMKFMAPFLDYCMAYHANPHSGEATTHARVSTHLYHDGIGSVLKTYNVSRETHTTLIPSAGSSGALDLLQRMLGVSVPAQVTHKVEESLHDVADSLRTTMTALVAGRKLLAQAPPWSR